MEVASGELSDNHGRGQLLRLGRLFVEDRNKLEISVFIHLFPLILPCQKKKRIRVERDLVIQLTCNGPGVSHCLDWKKICGQSGFFQRDFF